MSSTYSDISLEMSAVSSPKISKPALARTSTLPLSKEEKIEIEKIPGIEEKLQRYRTWTRFRKTFSSASTHTQNKASYQTLPPSQIRARMRKKSNLNLWFKDVPMAISGIIIATTICALFVSGAGKRISQNLAELESISNLKREKSQLQSEINSITAEVQSAAAPTMQWMNSMAPTALTAKHARQFFARTKALTKPNSRSNAKVILHKAAPRISSPKVEMIAKTMTNKKSVKKIISLKQKSMAIKKSTRPQRISTSYPRKFTPNRTRLSQPADLKPIKTRKIVNSSVTDELMTEDFYSQSEFEN